MDDLAALLKSVNELNANSARLAKSQTALRTSLDEIEEKLPDLVTKDQAAEKERKVRRLITVLFFAGSVVAAVVVDNRIDRTRDRTEQLAFDRSICTVVNYIMDDGVNTNRDAIRSLESAVRQAFELVVPSADAPPEVRARTNDFRREILARLDEVDIDANSPQLDCSGIGNGKVDFSVQEAILRLTTTTTTSR